MTDQVQTTSQENETQVQELTPDELEAVDGGTGQILAAMGDGSVRSVGTGDYQWLTHLDGGL
jgi:hypothetical protein